MVHDLGTIPGWVIPKTEKDGIFLKNNSVKLSRVEAQSRCTAVDLIVTIHSSMTEN